jgi:hypothetical protein
MEQAWPHGFAVIGRLGEITLIGFVQLFGGQVWIEQRLGYTIPTEGGHSAAK